MNCQEFRRKLLIEPRSRCREFSDHAASCPECAERAKDALSFEAKLDAALNPPDPVGLESRIISARSGAAGHHRFGFGIQRLALAAGLLLTMGLAGWVGYKWDQDFGISSDLERVVVNHIDGEPDHLHVNDDIGPRTLGFLLSEFGARVEGNVGHIRFAGRCAIGRHFGVHMVVRGQEGPVTVLIMPGKSLAHPRQIRSSRFSGVIVPTAYGSMAVVGERREPVELVLEQIQQSIIWGA